MKNMIFLLAGLILLATVAGAQPTVNVSGGGTDKIGNALAANAATGGTIVIDDSQTYTETQEMFLGPRYNATDGRRGFHIRAAAGQSPTIVLDGGGFFAYAGSADAGIGSNAGGRITIDCSDGVISAAGTGMIWYIGQENELASGQACRVTFENLEIQGGDCANIIAFGAGGNDTAPNTTNAGFDIRNCVLRGSHTQLAHLFGVPNDYASTINIEDSFLLNYLAQDSGGYAIHLGAYQLSSPNAVINIDRTVFYNDPSTAGPFESNTILGRTNGQIYIDHCDIVNEADPLAQGGSGVARAVALLDVGTCIITNSIVRGDVGVANFGSWDAQLNDSNLSATAVQNNNFTLTNTIDEWPVYLAYGANPLASNAWVVDTQTQSATHGPSPLLGSQGAEPPLNRVLHWELY